MADKTYKITFELSNGQLKEVQFTVPEGKQGDTPHIGDNGNWLIGDTDTGVKSAGKDGNDGLTPYIGLNGNWYIGETDTGVNASGLEGPRGTGLLPVTTEPSTYTTAVNGLTPAYRIALSKVKSEASVSEVYAGDTLRYSYYHYPVIYVDSSYVYCRTRVSIRGATGGTGTAGANGTDGKSAYQYALDGGYTGTEEEFAQKLAIDGYVVAQPEPPENTNVLWYDTDDNSEDTPSGGDSAPADWNAPEGQPGHVLNRTHYEAISKICEEVIIDPNSYDTIITLLSPLSIGETYIVHWGEEIYNCTCFDLMGVSCLGNQTQMGGDDTGEPFLIAATGNNGQVMGLGGDGDIKFSIDGKITVKIPEKYLPDSALKGCIVTVTPEEWATLDDFIVTMSQSYDPFIDYIYTGGKVSLALYDSDNNYHNIIAVNCATFTINQETMQCALMLHCRLYIGIQFKDITFVFYGTKIPPVDLT